MKVFVVNYKAEFDCESYNDVYLYDSFEKAYNCFLDIVTEWFNEDQFNTEFPIDGNSMVWETEEYDGHFSKSNKYASLFIEERHNVVNYLNVSVEEQEVL